MRVVLEGEASDEAAVDSGVPQGTVIAQLLFSRYTNDLPDGVKSTVRLFADDCLLYREIRNFHDHIILQSDVKRLEEWGMRFNAQTCYTLSIRSKSPYFYSLDGVILKHVLQTPT